MESYPIIGLILILKGVYASGSGFSILLSAYLMG